MIYHIFNFTGVSLLWVIDYELQNVQAIMISKERGQNFVPETNWRYSMGRYDYRDDTTLYVTGKAI